MEKTITLSTLNAILRYVPGEPYIVKVEEDEYVIHVDEEDEDSTAGLILSSMSGELLPNLYNNMTIWSGMKTRLSSDPFCGICSLMNLIDEVHEGTRSFKDFRRISAIKIIRQCLFMGLKEAKDLVDTNQDAWCSFYECKEIEEAPIEKLPLLINNTTYRYSQEVLKRRLAGGE